MKTSKKTLKIGGTYRIKYRGYFGFKHIYFGNVTDMRKSHIIFDSNLYLRPKDIIWIQECKGKNGIFELTPHPVDDSKYILKL